MPKLGLSLLPGTMGWARPCGMMVRRPLRSRAEDVRRGAMRQLGFIAGLADPPLPALSGSPLGDALNAVAACAHAAITGSGLSRGDLWALLDRFGLASHLAPVRPADHFLPARAPACP